jgi:hypothetical protein
MTLIAKIGRIARDRVTGSAKPYRESKRIHAER